MVNGSFQENRREFSRVNLELKGVYRVLYPERNEGCAEIQNLSQGGLMFISSDTLNKGNLLDMKVYCQDFDISVNAKVVWAEELSGILSAEYKFGIEYLKLSTIDKRYLSLIISSNHKT
jgi:c-di-GMP-binding flagellar brake protein YcgR